MFDVPITVSIMLIADPISTFSIIFASSMIPPKLHLIVVTLPSISNYSLNYCDSRENFINKYLFLPLIMIKIDKKDRKLLYYLAQNSRESDTRLAKKISLSKNAVKYRIERLRREQILKCTAVVNLSSLGYETCMLLMKFNEDIYGKNDIIEHFKAHPFTNWVATLSGEWDLITEFIVRDFAHMQQIVTEIYHHFGDLLNKHEIFFSFQPLRVAHLVADIYADLKLPQPMKPRMPEKFNLDETDKRLLRILVNDSSISFIAIAAHLGTSIDVVRYRMKKLESILAFTVDVSLSKIGYQEFFYVLKVRKNADTLKKRIAAEDSVTYATFDVLTQSLIFSCAFKTADGIDKLTRQLRKNFSDIIDHQYYFMIKEQVKFELFPSGL